MKWRQVRVIHIVLIFITKYPKAVGTNGWPYCCHTIGRVQPGTSVSGLRLNTFGLMCSLRAYFHGVESSQGHDETVVAMRFHVVSDSCGNQWVALLLPHKVMISPQVMTQIGLEKKNYGLLVPFRSY